MTTRPTDRWQWVTNLGIDLTAENGLQKLLHDATLELDAVKSDREPVKKILTRIGFTLQQKGVDSMTVLSVLKGLKSYHEVRKLRLLLGEGSLRAIYQHDFPGC